MVLSKTFFSEVSECKNMKPFKVLVENTILPSIIKINKISSSSCFITSERFYKPYTG